MSQTYRSLTESVTGRAPLLAALLACSACAGATALRTDAGSLPASDFPGLDAIRDDELRADLFVLAGEALRGREAGTIDELRASAWLAERARAAGLEPAGENGTYFQWFPLRRVRQSLTSTIAIGERSLRLSHDVALLGTTSANVAGPIVWLGATLDSTTDVSGKVVGVLATAASDAPPLASALAARRYAPNTANQLARPLLQRGAAAVLVVADAAFDPYFELAASNALRGSYALEDSSEARIPTVAPTLLLRAALLPLVSAAGARLHARLVVDYFIHPSVNVIARVPGSDPQLRGQVVLFSGHQDHDGIRARLDPAAPQLGRPRRFGSRGKPSRESLRHRQHLGSARAPRTVVLPQRSPALRPREYPRALLHHSAPPGLPHAVR